MSLADLKDESIAMTYYGCVARPCACPACAPRKHSPLPCACGRWQGVAESLFKNTTIAQFAALDTEARNAMMLPHRSGLQRGRPWGAFPCGRSVAVGLSHGVGVPFASQVVLHAAQGLRAR